MTFNSQEIIKDVRAQFEHMLDFVTGEQARTATADHIERGLFKLLLSLGAKLLQLFFRHAFTSQFSASYSDRNGSGVALSPGHAPRVFLDLWQGIL